MLTGETGIIKNAQEAAKRTKEASEEEQQILKDLEIEMDESQKNIFVTLYEDGTLTFSKNEETIE